MPTHTHERTHEYIHTFNRTIPLHASTHYTYARTHAHTHTHTHTHTNDPYCATSHWTTPHHISRCCTSSKYCRTIVLLKHLTHIHLDDGWSWWFKGDNCYWKSKGTNWHADTSILIAPWANSALDKLIMFFLFFPDDTIWHCLLVVSFGRQHAWGVGTCFREMACRLLKNLPGAWALWWAAC